MGSLALFAEISWEGVTVNGIFTVLGGAIVYLLNWWEKKRDKDRATAIEDHKVKRNEKIEDEAVTVRQWQDYAEKVEESEKRCQAQIALQDARMDKMSEEILILRVSNAEQRVWIRYGIGLLRQAGLKFEDPPGNPVLSEPPK